MSINTDSTDQQSDKPILLKAVELLISDPDIIKKDVKKMKEKYYSEHSSKKSAEEINHLISKKIISNYSYYAAFIGGATSLVGVIPGLGSVISAFGGATADAALCMKYQIEMTMSIAEVYGHDISIEEEKRLCFIIAGLGTINQAAKEGGKEIGAKAFKKMVEQYLRGATLKVIKEIFQKIGINFVRKNVIKFLPFGIGVIIGASANKALTIYIGNRSVEFYSCDLK